MLLLAPGACSPEAHPPRHVLVSYAVLEQEAGAKVTGVARGGF
ncbi:MAG: hypothetical protein ACLQB1_25460 [Streptosporangiaceae bacterium]